MHIYAIGDLHLSGEPPTKPMEIFGEHWRGHKEKIRQHWLETVTADDTVIICGDISWAMGLEEAAQDLDCRRSRSLRRCRQYRFRVLP